MKKNFFSAVVGILLCTALLAGTSTVQAQGSLDKPISNPDPKPIDNPVPNPIANPVRKPDPKPVVKPTPQPSTSQATATVELSGTVAGHQWVDLGLSVKWATCNVGAYSPSDFGTYYYWGDLTPSTYDPEDCPSYERVFSNDIGGNTAYDAARNSWGSSWRMPTASEIEELVNKCTWQWVQINNTFGYKVSSRKTGQSIFLPAGGWKADEFHKDLSIGHYWSSSPVEKDNKNSYSLYFDEGDDISLDWSARHRGRLIRPVTQ